ncbi:C2H2 type zinc finger domain protein [Penicillium samsonianum]|uniref:C2H2 type zinc finger domain protein n=1 Tax=Penicillium samsonianum TaxID=1882272 RepID=UPI002549B2D7|nr:C2H2 type zinc finger domain protein [Penicillium samsonianum]KAJ6126181.1 C2H2 type zinc finger domain protein [Penicillium samsonianum]
MAFRQTDYLDRHICTQSLDTERKSLIWPCGAAFTRRDELKRHTRISHQDALTLPSTPRKPMDKADFQPQVQNGKNDSDSARNDQSQADAIPPSLSINPTSKSMSPQQAYPQSLGPQAQKETNDPDRPRNFQSQFNNISPYRVILVDTESKRVERKADLTGFFCVEWQKWPLQGQQRYGESVARLQFRKDGKLSLAEGPLHEWLWEPCVADSLK